MRRSALLLAFVLSLCGCTQHIDIKPTRADGFAPWSDEVPPHRLAGGDEMDIRFLLNPELNDTKLVVGPDGQVTVPLLGPVQAGGLTIAQFRANLERGYASKLRVADLDVVLRTYGSARVFVGGDVKTPGVLALQGPTDALQAIAMAGGFLNSARSDEVVLIRRRTDNVPMLRTINVRRYAGSVDPRDDVPLQPQDVLFVPKAGIAEWDLFVDQYLNQAFPFSKSFNYNSGSVSNKGLF